MLSPIIFPTITYSNVLRNNICYGSSVMKVLAFGKFPENPIVNPNSTTQVIVPSAGNKFLNSVTVNPIATTSLSVTPTTSEQVFSDGPYGTVTVAATA
jgi:hypothetical protein